MLFCTVINAQTNQGTIPGTIKDINGKALDGANLLLKNGRDSTTLKHAFSDTSGNFQFTNIKDGTYLVSVQLIGFSRANSPVFNIINGVPSIPSINITLQSSAKTLNSVTIISNKPLIENKIDKTVVNVDAYITNSGNTALDLLSTSPNVAVDQTGGSISIKGKSGAVILIDGKQTYLGGTDLINLLNSMPSSQISQIEIMTQPSAKFDAAGNSGVINILTRKNKKAGFNANVSLNYTQGVYPKSLNSVILNYRNNKINVFGNLSYNYNQTFTDRKWLHYFSGDSLNTLFTQNNRDKKVISNIAASGGVDYAVSTATTVGILASTNSSKYNDAFSSHSVLQDFNNNGNVQAITDGLSLYDRPWVNNSFDLNLKSTLSKTQQISSDVNYDYYSFNENEWDNTINNDSGGSFISQALQHVKLPSSIKIYSAKVDYSLNLGKGFNLESGLKSSYVQTDDDAEYFEFQNGNYVLDVNQSNHFIYKENVNAAYVNYSGSINKWDLQAGLRAEQTNNNGHQLVNDQSFSKNCLQLFPSAYLSYSADKDNKYELSYSRRVDRPNYSDLNPFVQYLDVYTRTSGNVNLNPVFANNFELSYNYKNSLNISAFYTMTNGIINPVYLQSDTGKIELITLENLSSETSAGLSISYSAQLKNWWSLTAFYTLFNNHIKGPINDGFYDANITTHMISLTQQFLLGDGWAAEMNTAYRTNALLFAMFVRGPWRTSTFGLSKEILNKKGSIKLKFTDPFNLTKNNYNYTRFEGLYINRMFHEENQRIGITFTYHISGGQKVSGSSKKNYDLEENQRVRTPGS
jgi:hypothetical protein